MRLLILIALLMSGCGDSPENVNTEGGDFTQITISDSQIAQSCSNLLLRADVDCDDDEVRFNCEQCFDDTFREELNQNVEQCIQTLTEQGFCGQVDESR